MLSHPHSRVSTSFNPRSFFFSRLFTLSSQFRIYFLSNFFLLLACHAHTPYCGVVNCFSLCCLSCRQFQRRNSVVLYSPIDLSKTWQRSAIQTWRAVRFIPPCIERKSVRFLSIQNLSSLRSSRLQTRIVLGTLSIKRFSFSPPC